MQTAKPDVFESQDGPRGTGFPRRRAKIVCTIGPASNSEELIRDLMLRGMDVARLNFSHGTHDSHAVVIQRLVAQRFGGELRVGIGINTGVLIAGTIGGGSKLEFTLIGDTVNVAARVEQLTKTTGDAILLTGHTVDALNGRSPELIDRGSHALKGKSAAVQLFGLDPSAGASSQTR